MMKLKIPQTLAVAVLSSSLAACSADGTSSPSDGGDTLCPSSWSCSTDAARAFNCSDAGQNMTHSQYGDCYPPI